MNTLSAERLHTAHRPPNGHGQPPPTVINVSPFSAPPPPLNLGDIYYTLFRHKWKLALGTLAGVAAAATALVFDAPPYQSEAKLFVRYIISENRALGTEATAKSPDERGETIMKSEAEILGSLDLVRGVIETIGAEKILARAGGGRDSQRALALIRNNLAITVAPSTSVIQVVFRHPDPEVVQPVLREVINRYLKLHVETHTANGMIGDFLTQETDQLRSRLSQTEEELRRATLKAGIVSLEDAKKTRSEQLAAIRRDLFNAQAELAQRAAVLEQLNRRSPAQQTDVTAEPAIPPEIVARYHSAVQQVQLLQQNEREALLQFTPGSARVQEIRSLLTAAEGARDLLQAQHPQLLALPTTREHGTESAALDPQVIATQVTALEAKIKVLTRQLDDVRAEAAKVDQMEGTIVELRRKKELEEANYRVYAASLEQARINETLGSGRVSNISEIQAPSPPFSDHRKANKMLGLLLSGGLLAGLAWAFGTELYLDRSIKRPIDLERSVRVPLFLSIPALRRKHLAAARPLLAAPADVPPVNGHGATETPHPLQVFHETLRDRLIAYFESVNLTHKPKLVAVTGLAHGGGVTTTAAGLARSLSETGEGNVLLVDMNVGAGVAQQFLKGRPVCGIDELLHARDHAHVDENLYVVAESDRSDRLSHNLPQRFTKLVPKLKASDFDYIIFDMPPVSQISITPRLANFMDMVLLVVESERSDREYVQRAASLLSESRAHVGLILNKTRRYVPAALAPDHLTMS